MIPTQGAIGYDQIYYKLGRWQGDLQRPTWQADPVNQLVYLNKTIGKSLAIIVKRLVQKVVMILQVCKTYKRPI